MPGSRFTSTARRPGSRRGDAVSTTRRSHTRRRDGFPASVQSSGVCSGLSRRARSCTDKPRIEGLHGLGKSSRTRRGVERLRAELCWWRGRGHGARGCGRPALALTSTCIRKLTARRPVHSKATHATAAARPETRRGGNDVPARRTCGATRVRRRARRRGAGWPSAILENLPKHQTWRERSVDAAWGSHGPRFPPARHDTASSMGRRRRARSATGGSKARPQTGTRQGDGARGRDGHGAHSGSAV
jgi:hypothetical protein